VRESLIDSSRVLEALRLLNKVTGHRLERRRDRPTGLDDPGSGCGMLYGMPVTKPSRVAKVDSGNRASVVAAGTASQAVQGTASSQSNTGPATAGFTK
jgi:hypothetical protein